MDRHPRKSGLFWAGAVSCLVTLLGCQDRPADPPPAALRPVPGRSPSVSLASHQDGHVANVVVPVSHLFAAPPLPDIDHEQTLSREIDETAEPLVEEAPGYSGIHAASQPRRLPVVDALELRNSADAGAPPRPAILQLPPPPVADEDDGRGYAAPPAARPIRRPPPIASLSPAAETDADGTGRRSHDMGGAVTWPADAAPVTADQGPSLRESATAQAGRDVPLPQVLRVTPREQDRSPAAESTAEVPLPSSLVRPFTDPPGDAGVMVEDSGVGRNERTMSGPWYVQGGSRATATDTGAAHPPLPLRRLPSIELSELSELSDSSDANPTRHVFLSPPIFAAEPGDENRSAGDQGEDEDPATPENAISPADSDLRVPHLDQSDRHSSFPVQDAPLAVEAEPDRQDGSWQPVEVPVQPRRVMHPDPVPTVRPPSAVVTRQVQAMVRQASSLASRGAYYAARAEMIKALRVATQATDTEEGVATHSEALARGMRALEEAEDFAPRGSRLEADLDLRQLVAAHRTPVLKGEDLDPLTPLAALQKYFTYAQRQLTEACSDVPATSDALYGLGRIYTVLDEANSTSQDLNIPKAMAMQQAALLVHPENHQAANELGVLLARYGQLEDARRVLLHCLSIYPEPEAWHNLSVVHERLGEKDLAHRARNEWQLAVAQRQGQQQYADLSPVRWVDTQEFTSARPALGP